MGCGSSKGVAPAPAGQASASAASPLISNNQGPADVAALHKQRLEEQQLLQNQHGGHGPHQQHKLQQHDMSLPGRIDSTTTAPLAPPPLLKELSEAEDTPLPPPKAPAAASADAEFNYDRELQRGSAPGGAGAAGSVLSIKQQASTAQGMVVGGLLSKQPDWLLGRSSNSRDHGAGAGTASHDPAAPVAAGDATSSSTSSHAALDSGGSAAEAAVAAKPVFAQAPAVPAGLKASTLPPLSGRGLLQASSGSSSNNNNNSLPPLFAPGTRALAPLESQRKQQEAEAAIGQAHIDGSGSNCGAAAAAVAPVSETFVSSPPVTNSSAAQQHRQDAEQGLPALSHSRSSSSSTGSSLCHPAAAVTSATAGFKLHDPADPWSSLQSQYAHAAASPSPDNSMAGGSPPSAVAAALAGALSPGEQASPAAAAAGRHRSGNMAGAGRQSLSLEPGSGAAGLQGLPQGSRRGTGSAAVPANDRELVLVDSDDEGAAGHGRATAGQQQHQQQHLQQASTQQQHALGGSHSNRSSFGNSGVFRLSAQSSHQSVSGINSSSAVAQAAGHVTKSGGWGVGSLAGAGTIMLGGPSSATTSSTAAVAAAATARKPGPQAADDVFGDDGDDEGSGLEVPIQPNSMGLAAAAAGGGGSLLASSGFSSNLLRSSQSRTRVAATGGAGGAAAAAGAAVFVQETLDVEELEDDHVDALIESELARDGLPLDLAAQLAQFEAGMGGAAGDDDGYGSDDNASGAGVGGAGGADDSLEEGPSIYELMNHKQGSWRAA